jgi:hypothetical protein
MEKAHRYRPYVCHPLVRVAALTVVHELGERADMVGCVAEGGAAGQDLLELQGRAWSSVRRSAWRMSQ